MSPTLDATFFALSDPTRRGILRRLGDGPATISDLAGPAGMTLDGIKKHVAILEGADLVVTAKVGRARECRLGPATLAEATDWIAEHRRAWEARVDRFDAFAGEETACRSPSCTCRCRSTASSPARTTTPTTASG